MTARGQPSPEPVEGLLLCIKTEMIERRDSKFSVSTYPFISNIDNPKNLILTNVWISYKELRYSGS
jgi:hypothetical protein